MLNMISDKKPQKGNPFYNTKSNGGYSQCIVGKPMVSELNVLCNCVGFACGFFNEIIGEMKYPLFNCNAEKFIERAKKYYPELLILEEPTEGGIMVWEGIGDLAGHVAGVIKCNSANQVLTAESGYNSFSYAQYVRNKGNGNYGMNDKKYKYLGCIVNPALGEQRSYMNDLPTASDIKDPVIRPSKNDTKKDNDLLDLVRRTIKGDFGNGKRRKKLLGKNYSEVQKQVTQNLKDGNTQWSKIKLYK